MIDDEITKGMREQLAKLVARDESREIRTTVDIAVSAKSVGSVLVDQDITVNFTEEGIVLYFKSKPIIGFNDPADSMLFVDIFMTWTMAMIKLRVKQQQANSRE